MYLILVTNMQWVPTSVGSHISHHHFIQPCTSLLSLFTSVITLDVIKIKVNRFVVQNYFTIWFQATSFYLRLIYLGVQDVYQIFLKMYFTSVFLPFVTSPICIRPGTVPLIYMSHIFDRFSFCIFLIKESIKRRKIIKELSDLVTYCRSTRFRDFQTSTQSGKYYWLRTVYIIKKIFFNGSALPEDKSWLLSDNWSIIVIL